MSGIVAKNILGLGPGAHCSIVFQDASEKSDPQADTAADCESPKYGPSTKLAKWQASELASWRVYIVPDIRPYSQNTAAH